MKINWLLLITIPIFAASCGNDEAENDVFDGYRGSSDMIRNLKVNWTTAADQSTSQLKSQFITSGSSFFNKEIRWTKDNPSDIETIPQTNADVSVISQLKAAEVMIDNYIRTRNEEMLNAASSVLNAIYNKNGNSYIGADNTETAAIGLLAMRLYEATQDNTYWTAAKEIFDVLEEAGETTIQSADVAVSSYTNGSYGIPLSEADAQREISGNAMAVMMSIKMYNAANTLGESGDKYRNFANNVLLFCEGALYESTGLVYTSTEVSENGAYENQDQSYNSANQGYLLGACVAAYNMDHNEAALEYANSIAAYQVNGTNNDEVWHENYAVFYPSYGSGKIGTQDRSVLLNNGIFFRYLTDLIKVSENLASNTKKYTLCLTNNVETMWVMGQSNENCLWGSTWYQPPYENEYSSSISDEWYSKIVISLEAQTAGATLVEMKALL